MFVYYEDGRPKRYSMRKVFRFFDKNVDKEQKNQGTDFASWLLEMEKMQILIREEAR